MTFSLENFDMDTGAEENQVVPGIVWACFVPPFLWHSSALWAQVAAEEELG